MEELASDIGAPSRLQDVGVKVDAIPQMAKDTMKSSHIPANPREIAVEAVEALYEAAM